MVHKNLKEVRNKTKTILLIFNMGTWNYRILKETQQDEEFFTIRDVYYKDDKAYGYGDIPAYPIGDTQDELKQSVEKMLLAFEKPVLIPEDFNE